MKTNPNQPTPVTYRRRPRLRVPAASPPPVPQDVIGQTLIRSGSFGNIGSHSDDAPVKRSQA